MTTSATDYHFKRLAAMRRLHVLEKDCRIQFMCSPGKGGQNVNKVETAVRILHLPTGISVKCHTLRTQNANRNMAWDILLSKIENQKKVQAQSAKAKKEKLRRQKRGRSHKGKTLVMANKKLNSRRKFERSKNFIKTMD